MDGREPWFARKKFSATGGCRLRFRRFVVRLRRIGGRGGLMG